MDALPIQIVWSFFKSDFFAAQLIKSYAHIQQRPQLLSHRGGGGSVVRPRLLLVIV